jgi:methionine sulfoxide reductase heme-binding subunit
LARRAPEPWLKPAVFSGALVPLAAIGVRAWQHRLGANPIAELLNRLGLLTLVFLVLTLACTPAKTLFGFTWPARVRRMLGLFAFFYATLHFLTYAGLDQLVNVAAITEDIAKRPFIWVGFTAWVLLIPLAVTSTKGMLQRLGFKRWKMLHRSVYAIAALGALHFYWRVKKDATEPLIYATVIAFLLLVRVAGPLKDRLLPRRPMPRATSPAPLDD